MAPLRFDLTLSRHRFAVEVALEVGRETVAVVGPSGAGKTSVIHAIAGLTHPDRGLVTVGDDCWFDRARRIDRAPQHRSVGLTFQDYALFPHMTVRDNVGYGGDERVDELLERMRIGALACARPGDLSGGERQRVALARALARDPSVLLLDEPLSALDAHTRAVVRRELAALLGELALPTLLITHDFRDALALADRVAVIVGGRLHQLGTPATVAERPASATVAAIAGTPWTTGIASLAADGRTAIKLDDGSILHADEPAHGPIGVVADPCDVVADVGARPDGLNVLSGAVDEVVAEGGRVRVRVAGLIGELPGRAIDDRPSIGTIAHLTVPASAVRLVPLDPPAD